MKALLSLLFVALVPVVACGGAVAPDKSSDPASDQTNSGNPYPGVHTEPGPEAGAGTDPCGSAWFDRHPGGTCSAGLEGAECFANSGTG